MAISDYLGYLTYSIQRSGNSYVVHETMYRNGVVTLETDFTFQGYDIPEDITKGIYQALHPSTYLTDTYVQDAPLDLTDKDGLTRAFMSCSAMTSINLTTDVSVGSGTCMSNSKVFKDCTALQSVNLGTILNRPIDWTGLEGEDYPIVDFSEMFSGCTSLTSISGEINFNNTPPAVLVDMFKNCSNLNCTGLKIYNGATDSIYDLFQKYPGNSLEVDGRTVTQSYELLGLTKAQLHQATIYAWDFEEYSVIDDFEHFS